MNIVNHTQKDLDEIKFNFNQTKLPDNIIDYIVDDFINTFSKCKLCPKKNENLNTCECCEDEFCDNCIDTNLFFSKQSFCKNCKKNKVSLKKNVCNLCFYYNKNTIDCKICKQNACPDCCVAKYCCECYLSLDKDQDLLSDEDKEHFQCKFCNHIFDMNEIVHCDYCGEYNTSEDCCNIYYKDADIRLCIDCVNEGVFSCEKCNSNIYLYGTKNKYRPEMTRNYKFYHLEYKKCSFCSERFCYDCKDEVNTCNLCENNIICNKCKNNNNCLCQYELCYNCWNSIINDKVTTCKLCSNNTCEKCIKDDICNNCLYNISDDEM